MKRSSELRDLCVALSKAHSRSDAPFIERHVSVREGVLSIGSDPKEWMEGERVVEAFKEALQDDDVRSSPSEDDFVRELDAFVEGTVGWASSRFTWTTEDGSEIPMRWSAVFHLEVGQWKLVQAHASVGVPNEEVFGRRIPGFTRVLEKSILRPSPKRRSLGSSP
jgi:SnoaL-like domain